MTTHDDFENFDDDIGGNGDDAGSAIDDGASRKTGAAGKKGSKLVLLLAVVGVVGIGGLLAANSLGLTGGASVPAASGGKTPPAPPQATAAAAANPADDGMPLDLGAPASSDAPAAPIADLAMPPAIGMPDAVPSIGLPTAAASADKISPPVNPALQSGDTPAMDMPDAIAAPAAQPAAPVMPVTDTTIPDIMPVMPASDMAIANAIQPPQGDTAPAVTAPAIAVPEMPAAETPAIAAPVAAPVTETPVAAVPAPDVAAPSVSAPVSGSNAQLAAIEKALAELKQSIATKQDIAELNSRINALEAADVARQMSKPAAASGHDASPVADTPAPAKKKTVSKPKKPAPVAVESRRWVLKAAKPGMAWIAEPGSAEIRTISTGDTVPGLGRIKAIVKDSMGKWTVEGTQARVNQ